MKIKIGNKIYDSNKEPILLVLDESEKELIRDMGDQSMFCSFPEKGFTEQQIRDFMILDRS